MAFIILLGTILIGAAIAWYLVVSTIRDRQLTREYAARGLKRVPMNMLWNTFRQIPFEQSAYELVRREGRIYVDKSFNTTTIVCAEPDLIQLILSKEFTNFTNRRVSLLPVEMTI